MPIAEVGIGLYGVLVIVLIVLLVLIIARRL
jgi:hypothetical protein